MLRTALLTLLGSGVLASAVLTPPQSAESAATKLNAGQSFKATVSIQQIGGTASQLTLSFSKPNLAKLDTPDHLFVTDGTIMTKLDKMANTYSTTDFNDPALLAWINTPESFAWTPFFLKDTKKLFTEGRAGAKRKLRGTEVTSVPVTLTNRDTAELYIETETGLVRGYQYTKEDKTWIVWATKLEFSDKPLEANTFAFAAPAGATEAKEMESAATWASVAPIFKAKCMPCHAGTRPQAGLNLEDGTAAAQHRTVVPGDAANSRLVRSIKGQGKAMPPGGPMLAADDVAKIEAWINGGAQQ